MKVNFVRLVSVLPSSPDEVLALAVALSRPLLEHVHCLIVTLGANGLLVCGEHDGGSVNLQPRKHKKVRMSWYPVVISADTCEVSVSEEGALRCALPSTGGAARGDGKCVRSRRQVLKVYLFYLRVSYPDFI